MCWQGRQHLEPVGDFFFFLRRGFAFEVGCCVRMRWVGYVGMDWNGLDLIGLERVFSFEPEFSMYSIGGTYYYSLKQSSLVGWEWVVANIYTDGVSFTVREFD